MSIKVAVRVRPFNEREMKGNSSCCIKMKGGTTVVCDPVTGKEKPYTFDYSFWSHDGFEDKDGHSVAVEGSQYADQQTVYEALGQDVLNNAWKGFHCCLFAYGQTGSGKSYSMVGYGKNKGIVPISCDEIFKRIAENKDPDKKYQVQFSMLEIYNEKVQDLLADMNSKPQGGLKVRESQGGAVYVQGLSKHPVDSYEMIAAKTDEGYDNRSIGSTLMNQTSSRAHTIITIEFKQIYFEEGRKIEKFSVINLVDLAGSEKAGQTGASGDRLKEGCAINKSLTVLGTCISVLADKAMGKEKKAIVPYRDSNLTRILQNALGGNSKTIMICAISPANMNFEETLGTLRYADRAKKIVNKAVVNESATDKIIRELKTENEQLKKLLLQAASGGKTINIDELGLGSANDIIESMDHSVQQIEELEQDFDYKLKKQKEADEIKNEALEEKRKLENKAEPHLANLNEDPQLSQHIYYTLSNLKEGIPVKVGRRTDNPKPDIVFGGISCQSNHGQFTMFDNGLIQFELTSDEAYDQTLINGKKLPINERRQIMNHLDTIYFGSGAMLLFKYALQFRKCETIKKEIIEETGEEEANALSEEEMNILVQSKLVDSGLTDDISLGVVCEDYTEEEIERDHNAVDFDKAQGEVEKVEEEKRAALTEMIQEQERKKAQEEFEKKQKEEEEKSEALRMELLEKQREIEKSQKRREEELVAQEAENRQKLEDQLKAKEDMLNKTLEEAERVKVEKELETIKKEQEDAKLNHEKSKQQEESDRIRQEMRKQQVELEMVTKQMQLEKERQQKAMDDLKKQYENKIKSDQQVEFFHQKMKDIKRDVDEANEIAKFMNKDIQFTHIYESKFDEQSLFSGNSNIDVNEMNTDVTVKVENFDIGQIHIWSCDKFKDKLIMMKDALVTYENNDFQELEPDQDPFNEKQEPILLGQAFYILEGLSYMLDNPIEIPIVGTNPEIYGQVHINVVPCDDQGNEDLDEDLLPNDPTDLLNQELNFKVKISHLSNLPADFGSNIFCEYKFYMDEKKYSTPVSYGKNQSPEFNFEQTHHVDCVTKFLIDYLTEDKLTIKIFGNQDLKKKKIKASPQKQPQVQETKNIASKMYQSTVTTQNSSNSFTSSNNSSQRVIQNPLGN